MFKDRLVGMKTQMLSNGKVRIISLDKMRSFKL
jgi:hypothetical protein